MKTKILHSLYFCCLAGLMLFSGCDIAPIVPIPENPGYVNSNQKVFDVNKFENNVVTALGQQWTGYSYVIIRNGQEAKSGTFGEWIRGRAGKPADLNSPLYLASVNKTIASVALIIAMREFGSGVTPMVNTQIQPFLLPQLGASPAVGSLRFRDILTHRTGFAQNMNLGLSNMKVLLQSNTVAPNSPYVYSNVNFILVKYVLFRLAGQNLAGLTTDQEQQDKIDDFYSFYVRTRIFNPAGINSFSTNSNSVRYYQFGDSESVTGWSIGDTKVRLGSGGFYLNTLDLAKFQAYLNNSDALLKVHERTFMYNNYLGWNDSNPLTNPIVGTEGTYYSKQGSFINTEGQGVRTLIMTFPKNKVEVVFLANSRGGILDNTTPLNNLFRDAYDAAWD